MLSLGFSEWFDHICAAEIPTLHYFLFIFMKVRSRKRRRLLRKGWGMGRRETASCLLPSVVLRDHEPITSPSPLVMTTTAERGLDTDPWPLAAVGPFSLLSGQVEFSVKLSF